MSDWPVVWLAIMAIALVIMTVIQVAVVVGVVALVRQMTAAVEETRKEIRPLIEKLNRLADEVGRTASLATAQVERIDRIVSVAGARIEETIEVVHGLMGGPVRQGAAVVMAIRAVMSAFRGRKSKKVGPRDEDDALFVG